MTSEYERRGEVRVAAEESGDQVVEQVVAPGTCMHASEVRRRKEGERRVMRPRIGPTTSTTSTPQPGRAGRRRNSNAEDTQKRTVGFFPKQGIG